MTYNPLSAKAILNMHEANWAESQRSRQKSNSIKTNEIGAIACPKQFLETTEDIDYFGMDARKTFYDEARFIELAQSREIPSITGNFDPSPKDETDIDNELPDIDRKNYSASDSSFKAPTTARLLFVQESLRQKKYSEKKGAALKRGGTEMRAGVIIRNPCARVPSEEINLSYQGIGDKSGLALACALPKLPNVNKINLWDCQLSDASLGPILDASLSCSNITSLNLGSNKIDERASEKLGDYFEMPNCPLRDLGLSNADIDDGECCELVGRLKRNTNLTRLDLSHNLIGVNEAISLVDPTFQTGAQAIAELLRTSAGQVLEGLNLSWNSIRRKSSQNIGNSLAFNNTLVELDLSFNGFGDEGGLALGGSLFTNRTLRVLNLSNNSISCRAAFAIAVACRQNQTLEVLNLQGNPVGKVGGQSLMLVPVSSGERLTLILRNCDMLIEDPSFVFDKVSQLPREPGDNNNTYSLDLANPLRRAMGFEILRLLAEEPGFRIQNCSLNGRVVKLQRAAAVTSTGPGSQGVDDVVERMSWALDHLDDTWRKYDTDRSGTISDAELCLLLKDLGLDSSERARSQIFATFDCDKSNLLEAVELTEFLESSKQEYVERAKPRPRMVEVAKSSKAGTSSRLLDSQRGFELPMKGKFSISLAFKPTQASSIDYVGTTTSAELKTILDLASKTDDPLASLELSFGQMRLHLDQAQDLVRALLPELYDIVKVLARVLPCVVSASHAQVLVTIFLRENFKERRRLEMELGPAYGPLMGYFTGHYCLNLFVGTHRIAVIRLAEKSNLESKQRRLNRARCKDTSQKGNWTNFRNEKLNGSSIELNRSFFNPLRHSGVLEFDFVSTYRPTCATAVLSNRRFVSLVRHLGWLSDEDAQDANELLASLEKNYIPEPRVLSKEDLFIFDHEMALLRGNKDIPEPVVPNSEDDAMTQSTRISSSSVETASVVDAGSKLPMASVKTVAMLGKFKARKAFNVKQVAKRTHKGVTGDDMSSVRDVIYSRWFTAKQALWVLNNCPVAESDTCPILPFATSAAVFGCDEKVDNAKKVELVIYLFSRISDLSNFDLMLGALSPRDRARVTHRLGWLNIFSPHRPEQAFALDLREREDRLVLKLLVHLSVIEPGENILDGQFRWDRCVDPVPGWFLTQTFFREEGIPTKGNLKLRYFSGHRRQWAVRSLRTALMDVVLASAPHDDTSNFSETESLSTVDYIARSLNEGCTSECDVPITWNYDVNASAASRPWERTSEIEKK